jgi:hypothetical protein
MSHERYTYTDTQVRALDLAWGIQFAATLRHHEVRECKGCTSLISSDPRYGRKPGVADPDICECCHAIA